MLRTLLACAALCLASAANADDTRNASLPFCPSHGDRPDSNGDYRCDSCGFDGTPEALSDREPAPYGSPDGGSGTMSRGQSLALAFVIAIAIVVVVVILVVLVL